MSPNNNDNLHGNDCDSHTLPNYAIFEQQCWNGLLIPDLDHALHSDRAWLSAICRLPVLATAVASKTCILHAM